MYVKVIKIYNGLSKYKQSCTKENLALQSIHAFSFLWSQLMWDKTHLISMKTIRSFWEIVLIKNRQKYWYVET